MTNTTNNATVKFMGKNIKVELSNNGNSDNKEKYGIADLLNKYTDITLTNGDVVKVFCIGLGTGEKNELICVDLSSMSEIKIDYDVIKNVKLNSSNEQARFITAISNYKENKETLNILEQCDKNDISVGNAINALNEIIQLAENIENQNPIGWYQYKNITLDDIYNVVRK